MSDLSRTRPLDIAVMGAGLIGKRHIEGVLAEPRTALAAIIDPSPAARDEARANGLPWFASLAEALANTRPDGVIVATPNQLHVANALDVVAAGIPVLIEKPVADDAEAAAGLVRRAEASGVPILVGHHRRHNPIIRQAKRLIESGRLGRIRSVHGSFWVAKPDDYFEVTWRREPGAGPIFINLIHDVDLFRHLLGEVESVHAMESNAARGHAVEDTAVSAPAFRKRRARHPQRLRCRALALELGADIRRKPRLPAGGPVLLPDRRHRGRADDPRSRPLDQ